MQLVLTRFICAFVNYRYSVPDAPFAVPATISSDQLNVLLNELRKGNISFPE